MYTKIYSVHLLLCHFSDNLLKVIQFFNLTFLSSMITLIHYMFFLFDTLIIILFFFCVPSERPKVSFSYFD